MKLDPRLTLMREGRASAALEGLVPAAAYVEPRRRQLAIPAAAHGTARNMNSVARIAELLAGIS